MAKRAGGNAVLLDRADVAGFARLLLLLDQLVDLGLQLRHRRRRTARPADARGASCTLVAPKIVSTRV